MTKKKYSFSLLEVMIVLVILGAAASLIGLNIKSAVKKERFNSSVNLVAEKIQLAQELLLDYDTDVVVNLTKNEKGISCKIVPLADLPAAFIKQINSNSTFEEIEHLIFNKQHKTNLQLEFYAHGPMSSGELTLVGKNHDYQSTLYLPGYPVKINKNGKPINHEKAAFPEEMYKAKA